MFDGFEVDDQVDVVIGQWNGCIIVFQIVQVGMLVVCVGMGYGFWGNIDICYLVCYFCDQGRVIVFVVGDIQYIFVDGQFVCLQIVVLMFELDVVMFFWDKVFVCEFQV